MKVVNDTISNKLYNLLQQWMQEVNENIEHDTDDFVAWNALIEYLYELERNKGE